MIRKKNIKWYLDDPKRFLQIKPFTRGGHIQGHAFDCLDVLSNQTIETDFSTLVQKPISQDVYLTEYHPSLHHIVLNQTIPHIKVVFDGCEMPAGMIELTQTASFQKLIHSAHCRSLTNNPLEFNL